MSDDETDASRFFKRAEAFFHALARKRSLSLAQGWHQHPRFGAMRIIAVSGRVGALYVTLIFCATDGWLALEQARLWWHISAENEPFEFKHVEHRPRLAEHVVRGRFEAFKTTLLHLRWLENQGSVEEAVWGMYGKAFSNITKAAEALADPDNELPTDDLEEA